MLAENQRPLAWRRLRIASPKAALLMLVIAVTCRAAAAEPELTQTRERLRYAGRPFEQWRDQLLYDLDPKTCSDAVAAVAAFARRGYGDEAIAALAQTLGDDRVLVVQLSANALRGLGQSGVAALVGGLSDERPPVRMYSAQALGGLGAPAQQATDALTKLLSDNDEAVRLAAIRSLVTVGRDNEALRPTFQRMAASGEVPIRQALAAALSVNRPWDDWWLGLLVGLAGDDNANIRQTAGLALAQHGPPEKQVIDALKKLAKDHEPQVFMAMFNGWTTPGNISTKAIVLADALASRDDFAQVRKGGRIAPVINLLAEAPDQAEVTVPVLSDIVDLKTRIKSPEDVLRAIDALGRLGPAAKRAVPALEQWVFGDRTYQRGDEIKEHASRALRKIAASGVDENN